MWCWGGGHGSLFCALVSNSKDESYPPTTFKAEKPSTFLPESERDLIHLLGSLAAAESLSASYEFTSPQSCLAGRQAGRNGIRGRKSPLQAGRVHTSLPASQTRLKKLTRGRSAAAAKTVPEAQRALRKNWNGGSRGGSLILKA